MWRVMTCDGVWKVRSMRVEKCQTKPPNTHSNGFMVSAIRTTNVCVRGDLWRE